MSEFSNISRSGRIRHDWCKCGQRKRITSEVCKECQSWDRRTTLLKAENELDYFPQGRRNADRCLIAVRGYSTGGNDTRERVAFTICDNFPPFLELRHLRAVEVKDAKDYRASIIAAGLPLTKKVPIRHKEQK